MAELQGKSANGEELHLGAGQWSRPNIGISDAHAAVLADHRTRHGHEYVRGRHG